MVAANPVTRGRERRDNAIKAKSLAPPCVTAKQKALVLRLLREGATLSEICTMRGIVSMGSLFAARKADQAFDDDIRAALADGATAAIAEAAEVSRKAAESLNPDEMRIAESFHRCAMQYAEKCAPREYGQLIKLGNPEGGPLSLSVVSYAMPLIAVDVPKDGQLEPPRTRDAIDADFSEA